MSILLSPFRLRQIEFRNRIFVSPMCQYSSPGGIPTDWHLVHLGSRAVGGAGLVMTEATAVSAEGRISPDDAGIWNDEQARAWAQITRFVKTEGARVGVQLAHAGRKASTAAPWLGGGPVSPSEGGWKPIGPSAIAFDAGYPLPEEMAESDMDRVAVEFAAAAARAVGAGFEVLEVHAAHGYLLHEFLSPLSNRRGDRYGGVLENRMRFPLRVVEAVRAACPSDLPLFIRISATDWIDGGWDPAQSVAFARAARKLGADLIDCSSGAILPGVSIPAAPGYQVPFAGKIRAEADIATGAVGMITEARQAEDIVASGKADAVFLARGMLRDPYWPLHAARTLGAKLPWPRQYGRAD